GARRVCALTRVAVESTRAATRVRMAARTIPLDGVGRPGTMPWMVRGHMQPLRLPFDPAVSCTTGAQRVRKSRSSGALAATTGPVILGIDMGAAADRGGGGA